MSRRSPYSRLKKSNQIRAKHVDGMGDVVFLVFQCLNPECTHMISIREDSITDYFDIECPECGHHLTTDGETSFYDYAMEVDIEDITEVVEEGQFIITHEEYLATAAKYKYCIICNVLRPLEQFDSHNSRKSGKQGECRQCKKIYNSIKNGTRLTDQHRESSQRRRLLLDIANNRINSKTVFEKYNYKCFNCGIDLSDASETERHLDHTLSNYYLWPLTTETATLLCRTCNGNKSEKWPSEFYKSDSKLRELSLLTGIPYELLTGEPVYNPEAIEKLKNYIFVDSLLIKYNRYMTRTLIPLRNRLLHDTGFDFFQISDKISAAWIITANQEYFKEYGEVSTE